MHSSAFLLLFICFIACNTNTIYCNEKQQCEEMTITCETGTSCIIYCIGEQSCKKAIFNGDMATDVTINCEGKQSCEDSKMDCGSNASHCSINCDSSTSVQTCKKIQSIDCGISECLIKCFGDNCEDIPVPDISNAQSFKCTGDGCSTALNNAVFTSNPTVSSTINPTASPTVNPTTSFPRMTSTTHATTSFPASSISTRYSTSHQPIAKTKTNILCKQSNKTKIEKDSANCPDGSTDLENDDCDYGKYCQMCQDNSAGTNGVCYQCDKFKEPNVARTDCVYVNPWWKWLLVGIISFIATLSGCFCVVIATCIKKRKNNDVQNGRSDNDEYDNGSIDNLSTPINKKMHHLRNIVINKNKDIEEEKEEIAQFPKVGILRRSCATSISIPEQSDDDDE